MHQDQAKATKQPIGSENYLLACFRGSLRGGILIQRGEATSAILNKHTLVNSSKQVSAVPPLSPPYYSFMLIALQLGV